MLWIVGQLLLIVITVVCYYLMRIDPPEKHQGEVADDHSVKNKPPE
jgi:hypothetical protein